MKRERRWPIPYLDLSNTLFFFFVALFAIALLAIGDESAKAKIDTSSKYLITLAWRDGSTNDVDLWVKLPTDDIVGFRNRQAAFVSLDHDDLGMDSNTVTDADGNTITLKRREEIVYVRQTVPGTYTVNCHLYSQHDATPEPVTVTVTAVEPKWHVVSERKLILTDLHQEETAVRFTVDQGGNIVSTDIVAEMFVNQKLGER
jgi:hypothetical protein